MDNIIMNPIKSMQETYNLNVKEVSKSLMNFGINIKTTLGYMSFIEAILKVKKKWNKLTNSKDDIIIKKDIARSMVGIRYMNTLMAILN